MIERLETVVDAVLWNGPGMHSLVRGSRLVRVCPGYGVLLLENTWYPIRQVAAGGDPAEQQGHLTLIERPAASPAREASVRRTSWAFCGESEDGLPGKQWPFEQLARACRWVKARATGEEGDPCTFAQVWADYLAHVGVCPNGAEGCFCRFLYTCPVCGRSQEVVGEALEDLRKRAGTCGECSTDGEGVGSFWAVRFDGLCAYFPEQGAPLSWCELTVLQDQVSCRTLVVVTEIASHPGRSVDTAATALATQVVRAFSLFPLEMTCISRFTAGSDEGGGGGEGEEVLTSLTFAWLLVGEHFHAVAVSPQRLTRVILREMPGGDDFLRWEARAGNARDQHRGQVITGVRLSRRAAQERIVALAGRFPSSCSLKGDAFHVDTTDEAFFDHLCPWILTGEGDEPWFE